MAFERRHDGPDPFDRSRRDFLRAIGAAALLPAVAPAWASGESPSPLESLRDGDRAVLAPGQNGFYIIVSDRRPDTAEGPGSFAKVVSSLVLAPLGAKPSEQKPLRLDTEKAGRAVLVRSAPPGPYSLRVDGLENGPEFALTVLKGRVSQVLFYRDGQRRWRIIQLAPEADGGRPGAAAGLSELSRVQANMNEGRAGEALERFNVAKPSGIAEPITLGLVASLKARAGQYADLSSFGAALTERFPEFPDGHVAVAYAADATAEAEAYAGRREKAEELRRAAIQGYRQALRAGLPVHLPFLEFLWDGVRRHKIDLGDERYGRVLAEVAPRRILYQPWSAWLPR